MGNHSKLRLGVNIDHVATLRNARGDVFPDPVRAAHMAREAGADGITAHLREDRRHIRDADLSRLRHEVDLPLNMEMAATEEMQAIALALKPHAVCLVPEKRSEVTTEGGLDVAGAHAYLTDYIVPLIAQGIRVSLFIDADHRQIDAAQDIGAPVIELHTGSYCDQKRAEGRAEEERQRLVDAAVTATERGLEVHAGHGLCYQTVADIAKIEQIQELNIGHFLIAESIFQGLDSSIRDMRRRMDVARQAAMS